MKNIKKMNALAFVAVLLLPSLALAQTPADEGTKLALEAAEEFVSGAGGQHQQLSSTGGLICLGGVIGCALYCDNYCDDYCDEHWWILGCETICNDRCMDQCMEPVEQICRAIAQAQ